MKNSNNKIKKKSNNIIATIGFITLILSVTVVTQQGQQAVYGQTRAEEIVDAILADDDVAPAAPAVAPADEIFQNVDDGFRVKVPTGWAVEDIDNTAPSISTGFSTLATVCNEAIVGLGGRTECGDVTPESIEVHIMKIPDLDERPEVQRLILSQGKEITLQDLLIIFKENVLDRNGQYNDLRPVITTPKQVNVTDAEGTTISTTEGLLAEWQFTSFGPAKLFSLVVLTPDRNNGYTVAIQGRPASEMPTIPPEVAQIMNSFELVT